MPVFVCLVVVVFVVVFFFFQGGVEVGGEGALQRPIIGEEGPQMRGYHERYKDMGGTGLEFEFSMVKNHTQNLYFLYHF